MSTTNDNFSASAGAVGVFLSATAVSALLAATPAKAGIATSLMASTSVFAEHLDNPRGLKFGPDGDLYVALGGPGGTNSTAGQCEQTPPPVGPYTGRATGGAIVKFDAEHHPTVVVNTFPSSQTSRQSGSLMSGVADVAFIGDTLYALTAGAGCSHGVAGTVNGIFRINDDGSPPTLIADLSAFQMANPVAHPEPDDFEPDGTWYSMVVVRGAFYAVEPNHGEVDKITTGGAISRVVDVSATQGHVVPTAIAYHGNFYFGNLGVFPQDIGSSQIRKLTPSGQLKTVAGGFDMVSGLVFDNRDNMYVLEIAAESPAPAPDAGRITKVAPSGAKTVIVDNLLFPTGMTMGPNGHLYVSVGGFVGPAGGSILEVDPN